MNTKMKIGIFASVMLIVSLAAVALSGTYYVGDTGARLAALELDGDLNAMGNTITNASLNDITLFNGTTVVMRDPFIDIRAYGAKGTDSINDTAAFASILAANPNGGINILIPCGTFYLSKLTFSTNHDNIKVIGLGECSIIKQLGNNNLIYLNGADSILFQNFKVNFDYKDRSTGIVSAWLSHDITYDNMYFMNSNSTAILANGVSRTKVLNSRFDNMGTTSTSKTTYGRSVEFTSCQDCEFSGNEVNTFYGNGAIMTSDSSSASGFFMRNLIVSNNNIYNGKNDQSSGIHTNGGRFFTIIGNHIHNMNMSANGINGIFLSSGTYGNVVTGNMITNVSGNGIEIQSYDNLVIGNKITHFGSGSDGEGIYVSGKSNIIKDNWITNSPQHGVYITEGADHIVLEGNFIKNPQGSGTDTACMRLVLSSGMLSNATIRDNICVDDQSTKTVEYGIYKTGIGTVSNIVLSGNTIFEAKASLMAGIPMTSIKGETLYVDTFITNDPYVDVRKFGAIGNNKTDNCVALNAAVNWTYHHNVSSILIPDGIYYTSCDIELCNDDSISNDNDIKMKPITLTGSSKGLVYQNVEKVGVGAIIRRNTSGSIITIGLRDDNTGYDHSCPGITIKHLSLIGSPDHQVIGISGYWTEKAEILSNSFLNLKTGIQFNSTGDLDTSYVRSYFQQSKIMDNYFRTTTTPGTIAINLRGGESNLITRNTVLYFDTGIKLYSVVDTEIGPSTINYANTTFDLDYAHSTLIHNVHSEDITDKFLDSESSFSVKAQNNYILSRVKNITAFRATGMSSIIIEGNTIDSYQTGITDLRAYDPVREVSARNNNYLNRGNSRRPVQVTDGIVPVAQFASQADNSTDYFFMLKNGTTALTYLDKYGFLSANNLRAATKFTIGKGTAQVNITLTSPNAAEWCCGVNNSGVFNCRSGSCP